MHDNYFEGILQLRNPDKDIIDFVFNQVNKEEKVFITKQKNVINGVDLYFTSQRYLQVLGKKLKQNFCGELKVSKKLHTRHKQTGRELYRVNVMFRRVSSKAGSIIEYKGNKVKILKLGKKISARYLNNGKKLTLNYTDL